MTAQNSFFGNVIGSANQPNFTTASGVWRPSDIAKRLAYGPTVDKYGAWPLFPADPNFSSVTLLCHFDNNQTTSTTEQTTSNVGSIGASLVLNGTAQISSAQSKFAPFSLAVDAVRQNTTLNGARDGSNAGYQFGSGDFTIEFWVYFLSFATAQNIIDMRTTANSVTPAIYANTDNSVRYFVSNADRINSGASAVVTGQWYHIAVARSSTTTKMFIDGTQSGSNFTDSNTYVLTGITVGGSASGIASVSTNGYIAETRITKGVARYTSNFTRPSSRFPDY